eukprot:GHVQ01001727.1.p1 GENE.GHVQ01001727.1~~GHVQ01001727.1.p1  ORF type:complete len:341 (-),score=45.40 GHVQ01001727.1:794-1816(-)
MAHSMGCRLFMTAVKRAIEWHPGLFEICDYHGYHVGGKAPNEATGHAIQLVTITLLNPEYYLHDFIDEFPLLRAHCAHITVFADSQDGALWWSELFSRKRATGRSPFGLRITARTSTARDDFSRPPVDTYTTTNNTITFRCFPRCKDKHTPTQPSSLDAFSSAYNTSQLSDNRNLSYTAHPTPPVVGNVKEGGRVCEDKPSVEERDMSRKLVCVVNNMDKDKTEYKKNVREDISEEVTQTRRGGNEPPETVSRYFAVAEGKSFEHHWLDLDVIDTTFMDQNVGGMRHVFFNLNREVIEDLRELILQRKRAFLRTSRLDRRAGNVWVYRVAPSFLKSLYDW